MKHNSMFVVFAVPGVPVIPGLRLPAAEDVSRIIPVLRRLSRSRLGCAELRNVRHVCVQRSARTLHDHCVVERLCYRDGRVLAAVSVAVRLGLASAVFRLPDFAHARPAVRRIL